MDDKYNLEVSFNGSAILCVAYLVFMYKVVKKIF